MNNTVQSQNKTKVMLTIEEKNAYDIYASQALNALISKLPLLDRDGEFSEQKTQEQIDSIKDEIARSAHSYAYSMIKNRNEFINQINRQNEHR